MLQWLLDILGIVSITFSEGIAGAPGFPDAYDVITIVRR